MAELGAVPKLVGARLVRCRCWVRRGSEPNTSDGYTKSGFPDAVRAALRKCFPAGTGGIVCVLDNLELVETVGEARTTLDELRDRVFNLSGVRWVLCGSRGIVSRARTERLSGIFQAPSVVGPLGDESVIEAIRRRIARFSVGTDTQAPVTPTGFEYLYKALNLNLRDARQPPRSSHNGSTPSTS